MQRGLDNNRIKFYASLSNSKRLEYKWHFKLYFLSYHIVFEAFLSCHGDNDPHSFKLVACNKIEWDILHNDSPKRFNFFVSLFWTNFRNLLFYIVSNVIFLKALLLVCGKCLQTVKLFFFLLNGWQLNMQYVSM